MRSSQRGVVLAIAIAFGLSAQQPDTAGLSLLVQKLQTACKSKDPDAVLALWSDRSPQRAAQRDELQKILVPGSAVEIHESASKPPEVEGERARIRIERQTGPSKKLFVLECVKEQDEWKIWKQTPAAEELAARLAAANSDKEQADLLSANEDLISPDLAMALIDRGREARNHGDLPRAMKIFASADTMADRTGASQARALAFNNTGLVYYDLGEFAEALRWYQRARALSESLHDDAGTARALNNTAAIYTDAGELSASWETLQKSLALAEKLHDARLISNARGNMAIIHGQRGDYAQALTVMKEDYDLHVKSGDKRGLSIDLLNLGNVFLWQGDYAQSADHFGRAVSVSESAGMKPLTAIALMSLGRVAEFRGELPDAIAKYQRSLAIFNEVGDKPFAASDLSFIGSAYSALGDQAKAIEYFQKGLEIQKAIGIGSETVLTLARMAAAYNRKGEFDKASKTALEAQNLAETFGVREAIWRAHLERGKAYSGLGEYVRAEPELVKAIATIEDLRQGVAGSESERENFFEDKLEPYHRMLGVLVAAGRNADAFAYAERAKARVLLDALKNGRMQLAGLMSPEERQREQDLQIKLGSLNARLVRGQKGLSAAQQSALAADLNRARLEYASYETTLYAAHPQWKLESGAIEPVTLQQAVQLMPGSDSAFIEFAVTDDKLYAFVSAGGLHQTASPHVRVFVTPVARKDLVESVERFRQQLAARDLGFRASASALYRLLLAPATAELAGKRHLIVVPDGVLWELPFQALMKPDGHYLLDDCAISYAPSLTALRAMMQEKQQRKQNRGEIQLLAMGNPAWSRKAEERAKAAYRDQNLGNLPQAETEVRQLGRIYGENQSHIYIGAEARESRFKSESGAPNVLHLATHGVLNDASPLYSYLLLAGDGDDSSEDGLLEAWELLRMKLNAELVVLSACETARGRVGAGEGVIGLSWALFVSGVPATVLSEWKVESDSTSRLMVAFHQNRKKGMSDADALRFAELGIRKDPAYQHPFYWAPFIVIGAGM